MSKDSVSYDTIETPGGIFALLTLIPADSHHLLTLELMTKFRKQLVKAKTDNVKGLITTHQGEWFSGGFDYKSATEAQLVAAFANLIADLIQLPFPTVAYVKGRAYGAGFTLGLIHDYLVVSNDAPVSLRQDELPSGHEVPPYAVALVRDKFQLLTSLALLVKSEVVKAPLFAPILDYVKPYIGLTLEEVVDKLLEPLVPLAGDNYRKVREKLLPGVWELVKPN